MAADLNKPVSSDLYTQILADIRDMQAALAKMNHAATANLPAGVIQWSDANGRFEKWNGSAWVALLPDATTTQKGITQLSTSVTSTSTTLAATASAVKSVKDSVNALNFTNIAGTAAAAQIPNLDAAKITTGTLAAARVPALSALNGACTAGQVPSLDAAKITTGTLAAARVPNIENLNGTTGGKAPTSVWTGNATFVLQGNLSSGGRGFYLIKYNSNVTGVTMQRALLYWDGSNAVSQCSGITLNNDVYANDTLSIYHAYVTAAGGFGVERYSSITTAGIWDWIGAVHITEILKL